jgi:hypothetical protein
MIEVCDKFLRGDKNISGYIGLLILIPLIQKLSLRNIILSIIIIEDIKTRRDPAKAYGGQPSCWVSVGFYIIELLEHRQMRYKIYLN